VTSGAAPSLPDTIVFDLGNVVLGWNVVRILESLDTDPAERDLLQRELFAHPDWLALDNGQARARFRALVTGSNRAMLTEAGQLYDFETLWIPDGSDWLLYRADWTVVRPD